MKLLFLPWLRSDNFKVCCFSLRRNKILCFLHLVILLNWCSLLFSKICYEVLKFFFFVCLCVESSLESAEWELFNLILCHCKTASSTICSCKIAELRCSVVCLHCNLDVYKNAPEVSFNIEENEYDDQEVILLSSEHIM